MSIKNLAKTIVKFAAIVLGVFILSQAVSAKSYSFNLSYSSGNYPSYVLVGQSYPGSYYYTPPIISYDYYYPPLDTYGTYYADAVGGYPFGGYYNTYSPYDYGYGSYYSSYYPGSYYGYGGSYYSGYSPASYYGYGGGSYYYPTTNFGFIVWG